MGTEQMERYIRGIEAEQASIRANVPVSKLPTQSKLCSWALSGAITCAFLI